MKAVNIPVCCETCLYLATHEKCNGCLSDATGGSTITIAGTGPTRHYRYDYAHYETATLGEALRREHARQVSGETNIVVGGMGEAEVNSRWTVNEAYKELHAVSGACGYMTASPRFEGDQAYIRFQSYEGEFFLIWKSGVFDRIEDKHGICHWDRHPGFLDVKYSKKVLEGYGFPRRTAAIDRQ